MAQAIRRPNFFILGAPKSGTTSVYRWLSCHPSVYMPAQKEPHFFAVDLPRRRQSQTEDQYLALFSGAKAEHRAVGEASTWYLYSREAAVQIRQFAPDARVLVFFRNPVEFVQSLHDQFSYDSGRHPNFRAAWRNDSECFVRFGSFGTQFRRLIGIFPRAQVLPILFDDLVDDAPRQYRRILQFLGIADDGRTEFTAHNTRKLVRSTHLTRFVAQTPAPILSLWTTLKRVAGVRKLGLGERIIALNTIRTKRAPVDAHLRREILSAFETEIHMLSALLKRDLSHWAR